MTDLAIASTLRTDYREIVTDWLSELNRAAEENDVAGIVSLLAADPWWRDLYALSWDLTAMHGADQIGEVLTKHLPGQGFGDIALDETIPVSFQNGTYIEALYTFSTKAGVGRGVVRLVVEGDAWRAWTLSTSLDGLKDFPERHVTISDARRDEHNQPVEPGARRTLAEIREEERSFLDRDPSVLILGAGHSGMFLSARLKMLGVPTLMVDTYERAGDNWRLRYNGLYLHDTKWYSQFPYMMYPDSWPLFTPKEMLADWMEAYVNFLQLNLWTNTWVESAKYDPDSKTWTVEMDRDGEHRTLRPNHLVFATGNHGVPTMPKFPGQDTFRGVIAHSSTHQGGDSVKGKGLVVLGGGSSAHDIAQDAYESEASSVTMVQRSKTYILSQRNGVPIFHGTYYSEDSPRVHEADLLASSMPMALVTQTIPLATRMISDQDKDMIEGLESIGFETWLGDGDAGMMHLGLVRGGGYYIDKGCAQLLIDGKIRLQKGSIDHFTDTGVVYTDGTEEEADVVVFSTGYSNMREATRPVVGDEVADQLGLVWGIDETGEQRTTLRHSGHEKLWFMANGFQQSRIHSKHVALMIKAMDEGLLDPSTNVEKKTTAMHP